MAPHPVIPYMHSSGFASNSALFKSKKCVRIYGLSLGSYPWPLMCTHLHVFPWRWSRALCSVSDHGVTQEHHIEWNLDSTRYYFIHKCIKPLFIFTPWTSIRCYPYLFNRQSQMAISLVRNMPCAKVRFSPDGKTDGANGRILFHFQYPVT